MIICDSMWSSYDVTGSPHVRFLEAYIEHGKNWDVLFDTDYAKRFHIWQNMGFVRGGGGRRDRVYCKLKINNFLRLFNSIKKRGYSAKSRINVLREPFWLTRYGVEVPFKGREIWHGHHRVACCYMLGKKTIPGFIMKDKLRGKKRSKFDERLKGVKNDRI